MQLLAYRAIDRLDFDMLLDNADSMADAHDFAP
jgi:hypothetical protein